MENNIDEFDDLLEKQPDIVNSLRGNYGWTLLMMGCFKGHQKIVSLLSQRDHDLSIFNDDGLNVLHFIVWNNDDDVSLELLNIIDSSQISDIVNEQTNKYDNDTPLHHAARWNMHKSIVWLLEHGADPSFKIHGRCPDEQDRCGDETIRLIRSFLK